MTKCFSFTSLSDVDEDVLCPFKCQHFSMSFMDINVSLLPNGAPCA